MVIGVELFNGECLIVNWEVILFVGVVNFL